MPGDSLLISGTCAERVTITTDRLTLDGQGQAIIDGGGAELGDTTEGVVAIQGAQGVMLTGLTVQNGPDGIIARQGAALEVRNTICQDNADEGLQVVENSTMRVRDVTLQRNGDEGVVASRTSTVWFFGTVVSQNNGGSGFAIHSNSSASANTSPASGRATLRASNNMQHGFVVDAGSNTVMTETSLLLENNSGDGLVVSNVSQFFIGNISTLIIANNGGRGVYTRDNSHADLVDNMQTTIADNAEGGLIVTNNASVVIFGPADVRDNGIRNISNFDNAYILAVALNITTTGSSNRGIEVHNGHLRLSDSTVTGHITDISASFGSRLELFNTTFNNLTCDATVLLASDTATVCPTGQKESSTKERSNIKTPRRRILQEELIAY